MFFFTYAAAFLAILFAVGAAAFLIRKRSPLSCALSAYMIFASMWIGANAVADVSYTPFVLLLSSRIALSAGIGTIFCFLLLIDLLIDRRLPPWSRLLLFFVPNAIVAALSFSHLGILDYSFPVGAPAQITPGPAYTLTLLLLICSFAYGIVRFTYAIWHEHDRTRTIQLVYVFAGLLATLGGQVLFDILLPLLGEYRFYSLGPISSGFFALCCGYAISRHRLLDVRIAVQRSIIYSALFALIAAAYAASVEAVSLIISTHEVASFIGAGVATLVCASTIPVIDRWFRRRTDRFFFKDTYDYAHAMHRLSETLQTASLDELVARSETELSQLLRAEYVCIALSVETEARCENLGAALRVPLFLDREPLGSILVGAKRSGDDYAPTDLQLLHTFANQAATALSRVQLYERVRAHADELEERVTERTSELQQAQESQRQMMLDLSHNLQTPLAVLQTRIESMKREGVVQAQSMEQSISALSDFIYDLLALARLEETLKKEPKEPFSLSELMHDICEEVHIITDGKGVDVSGTIAPDVMIVGNAKRLREAIVNIAHNAVKYLGASTSPSIRFSLSTIDRQAVITITDSGIGIPEAELPRIFERFYRVRTPEEFSGTGLGLSITKQIITEHGGTIEAASTLGEGSTFRITLPWRQPKKDLS